MTRRTHRRKRQPTDNYQQLVNATVKRKLPVLLLGIAILLAILLVIIGYFVRNNPLSLNEIPTISLPQAIQITKPAEPTSTEKLQKPESSKKYTVKAGDNLWDIAQAQYGSGFNAYDIATANNISNPSIIEIGQELIIPSVTPKAPTTGEVAPGPTAATSQVTFKGTQYTIQHGDYLWKIAEAAYGDGYMWTRIAEANHLENPSLIHAGNVLIIPR